MRKQHNRLGYFTKPFIYFLKEGRVDAHINHCAKYNVEAINDEGISGRPQSVVYTSEKEFKILQSENKNNKSKTAHNIKTVYCICLYIML